MAMMVRRDMGDTRGFWGVSEAPFTDWKFTRMEFRVGGPDFLPLDDGTIIAGSRTYYIPSAHKTALYTGKADRPLPRGAVATIGRRHELHGAARRGRHPVGKLLLVARDVQCLDIHRPHTPRSPRHRTGLKEALNGAVMG